MHNVRSARNAETYGGTSELLSRNELDMTLHQIADSLLTRRLAEREIAVKLRENYRKAAGVTSEA